MMKTRGVEKETFWALAAFVVVIVVWASWAWIFVPRMQASLQRDFQSRQPDPAQGRSSTDKASPAESTSSSPRVQVTSRIAVVNVTAAATASVPEPSASDPMSPADYFARLGQTGDLFGGVNALFAALAMVAVFWAGALQRRTIQEARQSAAKQHFETVFFELLNLNREVLNNFERRVGRKDEIRVKRGYAALNGLASRFFGPHRLPDLNVGKVEVLRSLVQRFKTEVYAQYPSSLGPYFRLLFQIFHLVESAPIEVAEKVRFANIARGQIGDGAVLLLALNGLTWRGTRFVDLINRFGLLEHMHHFYLQHYKAALLTGYRETAFMGSTERSRVPDPADPMPGPLAFDKQPGNIDFVVTQPVEDDFSDELGNSS